MCRMLILSLMLLTHGGIMADNPQTNTNQWAISPNSLPVDSKSKAELLSATHLFTVEITRVEATAWKREPDQLEHRQLRMTARLLECFKGQLDVAPGGEFPVEAPQRRQSEFIEMDYMGLWSHAQPAVDVRYLIVAQAGIRSPSALMQDGSCKRLFDVALAEDVKAAIEAEQAAGATRRNVKTNPDEASTQALLHFAQAHVSALDELFGRYLWARVKAVADKDPVNINRSLLALLTAPEAKLAFRETLIEAVDELIITLERPSQIAAAVAKAYSSLLLKKEAEPLREALVDNHLYSAVFEKGHPRLEVRMVFPDSAEREQLRRVIGGYDSVHAKELQTWLKDEK